MAMTHLEIARLMTDYVDGLLDVARTAEMASHLETCAECRGMLDDVRFGMAACSQAEFLEPAPWLLHRILRATSGERKVGFVERITATLRPVFRPQVAYSLSMVIFSLSFILYAAKVPVRSMTLRDLNPATWFNRANSRGHILAARAEKYYYDIRFVYQVQSILQDLRQQPSGQHGAPKQRKAPGTAHDGVSPEAPTETALNRSPAYEGVAPEIEGGSYRVPPRPGCARRAICDRGKLLS